MGDRKKKTKEVKRKKRREPENPQTHEDNVRTLEIIRKMARR